MTDARTDRARDVTVGEYASEADDPLVLSSEDEDRLLAASPWRRFVVLGDSVAEGIHDPVSGYDPGAWADRLAEALRRQQPGFEYLNLGTRDLRAAEVRATQLRPALDFEPDLAAVVCGGNDLIAEDFDPDDVAHELDGLLGALNTRDADLITFTLYNMPAAMKMPPEFGAELVGRLEALNERVRAVSARVGAHFYDFYNDPISLDRSLYAADFRHCSARGYAIAASRLIERLGRALDNRC